MTPLRILVAPSGFKEGLGADEAAEYIARGILRVAPDATIFKVPVADGGEGFTKILVDLTGGILREALITGPVGSPVRAQFGFLGAGHQGTAVLEMAAAAGLRLVPPELRDPLRTTTFGVGELIRAALDAGAGHLLIGCGDSGTSDGGAGMAQALGVRLLDAQGAELGRGGAELARLAHIDLSGRDRRIQSVGIDAACGWENCLCGPHGAARVFGLQKGASAASVERLVEAFERYADVIARDLGIDVRAMPGGGSSGGLGAGLHALLGATLHPRYDIFDRYFDLDAVLREVDLAFTAEGRLDGQTLMGKVPVEIARRARRFGLSVIVLAGAIGTDADLTMKEGIDAYVSILRTPSTLAEAISETPFLLQGAAEQVMRLVLVGARIPLKTAASPTFRRRQQV